MDFLKKYFCLSALVIFGCAVQAQNFKILHYTETSGFDHQTRQASLAMMQDLGSKNGFTVDDDQTGAAFNSLSNLQQYAVVVFSNTPGDAILDSTQRANFEAYINAGGSLVGIHAASDTYRHSTANGTNTGAWDFYAETLGASVQQSPNHTISNYNGTMEHIGNHPATSNTPNPWHKVEEYYYWENGYLNPTITSVLQVRSTGGQSYDASRPISWYQNLAGGGRSFYTALGHDNSNFTSDTAFQNHIKDAIFWAAGWLISLPEKPFAKTALYPNPAKEIITLETTKNPNLNSYRILNTQGKLLLEGKLKRSETHIVISLKNLLPGSYLLVLQGSGVPSKPLHFNVSP